MSKRFPLPEFDRDQFKNRPWSAPSFMSAAAQQELCDAAKRGEVSALGAHAVAVEAALASKFKFEGTHLHAVMCVLPRVPVKVVGRSWAWAVQRALILDSLDSTHAQVLADWTTPRPMSTRLGPDDGVSFPGRPVYVLLGNRYGDRFIANRTLVTSEEFPTGNGYAVLSASGDENNDFHACNLSFSWS